MNTSRAAIPLVILVAILAVSPAPAIAENRTVSWNPSTTYTDGTPFAPGTTVRYDVYWSVDPGLSPASLQPIASLVAGTSTPFDPDALGMPRGTSVYITADAVLNTGETSTLAVAYAWNVPALSSLSIAGPSSVNENGSGTYAATATWSDNTTTAVTPVWSENSAYATISAGGVLTASAVTSSQPVTVSASYTSGGVTRTASQAVTIVDVPATQPSPPQNIQVSGPVSTFPSRIFRLSWDPVTTYGDGTPIAGAAVSYTAYWTTDPALSSATLQQLAQPTTATSVDFDPAADGIATNTRVYLAARAAVSPGQQSPLSGAVSWMASNSGPDAPANGRIYTK
ncbi:MAG TPA: hypothetical protein VIU37_10565 [Candidatus Limnocylindrales bacterium]